MPHAPHTLIPEGFDPIPSRTRHTTVAVTATPSTDAGLVGRAVSTAGAIPSGVALSREALTAAGFTGKVGETLAILSPEGTTIAIGVGAEGKLSLAELRDAAAAFARAGKPSATIATDLLSAASHLNRDAAVAAIIEGSVLARYSYDALKTKPKTVALEHLELLDAGDSADAAIAQGLLRASAGTLARDLAAAPPAHLTATVLGELAEKLGAESGLEVTIFDKKALIELGCGGVLGVNAGSAEEPRMIQLRYRPAGADGSTPHLALVGKGIMYDSGGISLKPSDAMHLAMKMDMAGAGAVLAAMTTLRDLGCTNSVTAYLMCTDNMPSGTAMKLGDVLTIRNGTTVEIKNTDAEGRLVLSDGLALAVEEGADAIVDIATLTGAALVALGPSMGTMLGNNQELVDQLGVAAASTDETTWQLPLDKRYRKQLDSDVADISNMGGPFAGATTAALFLSEFVGETPWAHLDIAGTMQSDADDSWRTKGPTGFGARLLTEFALGFTVPAK